jgi:hypothetical protein
MRAYKFMMAFNFHLEAFQIILADGIQEHALLHVGDTRNLSKTYAVPEGDEIKCIRIGVHPVESASSLHRVQSLQFTTKLGVESAVFAGSGAVS